MLQKVKNTLLKKRVRKKTLNQDIIERLVLLAHVKIVNTEIRTLHELGVVIGDSFLV